MNEKNENGYNIDDFMLVICTETGNIYPEQIVTMDDNTIEVKCLEKNGKRGWRWPAKIDKADYYWRNLYGKIATPKVISH